MIASPPRMLLMSSDAQLTSTLSDTLRDLFSVTITDDSVSTLAELRQSEFWGLLADLRSVEEGGHQQARCLEQINEHFPQTRIIVLTNEQLPEPIGRLIVCNGLQQVCEPLNADEIAEMILANRDIGGGPIHMAEENGAETDEHGLSRHFQTGTPAMRRMLDELQIAAEHDVTVMLIGETGSGKTYLSKLIHDASPRRDEPFVTVACGALPNDLIESELFGHLKGSFTSAHADKEGKFVAAGRGTILLDEIDVLGPEQQVKLLRVIESGEFEPVGSNQTLKSQARIIVASNLELEPLVEQGRFRPDLYYRLNMLKFNILPLRNRRADIIPLAVRFIEKFADKHGVEISDIDDRLYNTLLSYPWPGNVRELEHVIQRAVIYCRDGQLRHDHLPTHITAGIVGPSNEPVEMNPSTIPATGEPQSAESLQRQVAFTEREIIEHALLRNSNSRTRTAKDLGISRVTLYNKMKKYGISM